MRAYVMRVVVFIVCFAACSGSGGGGTGAGGAGGKDAGAQPPCPASACTPGTTIDHINAGPGVTTDCGCGSLYCGCGPDGTWQVCCTCMPCGSFASAASTSSGSSSSGP